MVAPKLANMQWGQRADRAANLPVSAVTQPDATCRSLNFRGGGPLLLVLDPGGAISASAAKPETHSGKKKAAQMGPPSLGRKRPRKQTARPRAALLRCTSYSPRSFVCNRVFATQQPENARHSYYWLVARRCGKFRVEETPTRPAIPAGCSRFRKTNEGRQPSRAPLRSRTPGAVIAGGLALPAHEAVWRGSRPRLPVAGRTSGCEAALVFPLGRGSPPSEPRYWCGPGVRPLRAVSVG